MNTSQLVNWDASKKQFSRFNKVQSKTILANAIKKRHPALEELVATLTQMWADLGINEAFCAPCFAGRGMHGYDKAHHGCCESCPNLGVTGCVAKPLGCALFFCGHYLQGAELAGRAHEGVRFFQTTLRDKLDRLRRQFKSLRVSLGPVYANGYQYELEYKLTADDAKFLRAATKLVKRETKTFLAQKRG